MASKKELNDQLALLQTFESNLKIMEFELLKKLERYKKMYNNNLFNLIQNSTIIENISKRWVNNSGSFFEHGIDKKKPTLYVLVGPKKIDKFSLSLLGKFGENIEYKIGKLDYVVTIGEYVNQIAKKLGLTIISHFPTSIMSSNFSFLDKVSAIIRVLTTKHLISESHILFSETSIDQKGKLLSKKILPISIDTWYEELEKEEDLKAIKNLNKKYADILEKSYEDDVEWYPSILDINSYMINAIIKLKIDIISNKNKMKYYEREYQLIQSKKDKIKENQDKIQLGLNKIRKEAITNDILVLASAFKTNDDEDEDGAYE